MQNCAIIGSRGSALALCQANWVRSRLIESGFAAELKIIKTTGDRITDAPLSSIGGKGVFTKEVEEALLGGEIDLAVHSMKDLPTSLPEGLSVAAVPVRADVRDVLISRSGCGFADLPPGAAVGSSSLRRQAQLRRARPDLGFVDLRGNLDTRLRKLHDGACDAIVLAAAGLGRLGWLDRVTEYISPELCLPAPGQGALALEIRSNDRRMEAAVAPLDDGESRVAVAAERAFLEALGGGCQVPIGALATIVGPAMKGCAPEEGLEGLGSGMRHESCRDDEDLRAEEADPWRGEGAGGERIGEAPQGVGGARGGGRDRVVSTSMHLWAGFADRRLRLDGFISELDGSAFVRGQVDGAARDPEGLGARLASELQGRLRSA